MGNSVNVPYNSNVAVCKLDMDRCMRRKIRRFIIDSSTNRSTNDTQSGRETTFAKFSLHWKIKSRGETFDWTSLPGAHVQGDPSGGEPGLG